MKQSELKDRIEKALEMGKQAQDIEQWIETLLLAEDALEEADRKHNEHSLVLFDLVATISDHKLALEKVDDTRHDVVQTLSKIEKIVNSN